MCLAPKQTPSFRVTIEEVIDAAPDVVLVAPCGYTAEQATEEFRGMKLPSAWHDIPAVRNGQVYALEANSYFSRPGPRLMTGLEILAKVLHPRSKSKPRSRKHHPPAASEGARCAGLKKSSNGSRCSDFYACIPLFSYLQIAKNLRDSCGRPGRRVTHHDQINPLYEINRFRAMGKRRKALSPPRPSKSMGHAPQGR